MPTAELPPHRSGLPAWPLVLPPHPDVVAATADDFAADLLDPGDPEAFFARTHLTRGLRELVGSALRRLGGDPHAPAVISLESGFGAGKTHTLLTLWHAAAGEATHLGRAAGEVPVPAVTRAALVGTHLAVTGSLTPDAGQVGTAWGELARKLGGDAGFALVAQADASRTSPAGALRDLLAAHAPCLILLDEWPAYVRQLVGREDLPAGTFETQLSFVQALTEAACAVPGALVVVSLPTEPNGAGPNGAGQGTGEPVGGSPEEAGPPPEARSPQETAPPEEEQALRRLRQVVRRVAEPWRPPGPEEALAIVRRRLFAPPDLSAQDRIAEVAQVFADLYAAHRAQFPERAARAPRQYADRIAEHYPLHPELVDRLLTDWAARPEFQRTRGLLRLLSAVVGELAATGDPAPLILPGTLPLGRPRTAAEVLRALPDDWQAVLESDVDGPGSVAAAVDHDRAGGGVPAGTLARRLARTVFLASAPVAASASASAASVADPGPDLRRIRLGAALPGDPIDDLTVTAELLARRSGHLHADGRHYRYARTPSAARLAAERGDELRTRPEVLWAEVIRRLRSRYARPPSGFTAVRVAPDDGADIPDSTDLCLVVTHPALGYRRDDQECAAGRFALDAVRTRGAGSRGGPPRVFRNRLAFLAADAAQVPELADAAAEFLAWDHVRAHPPEGSAALVGSARRRADDVLTARLAQAYVWVLVPEQPDPTGALGLAAERVGGPAVGGVDRVTWQLRRAGLLASTVSASRIRADLDGPLAGLWRDGHVDVGTLWEQYARHVHLTRLPDRAALLAGVAAVVLDPHWETAGFALADGHDSGSGRYRGLVLPGPGDGSGPGAGDGSGSDGPPVPAVVRESTLVVAPRVALAQCGGPEAGRRSEVTVAPGGDRAGDPTQPPGSAPTDPPARFVATYRAGHGAADPTRAGRDVALIGREIVQVLASAGAAEVEVTVRVRAGADDGFADETVRTVRENARVLRLQSARFDTGDDPGPGRGTGGAQVADGSHG